jgi:hypothetical protein
MARAIHGYRMGISMLLKPTLLYVISLKTSSGKDVEVIHSNHRSTLTECLDKYTANHMFVFVGVKTYLVGEEL